MPPSDDIISDLRFELWIFSIQFGLLTADFSVFCLKINSLLVSSLSISLDLILNEVGHLDCSTTQYMTCINLFIPCLFVIVQETFQKWLIQENYFTSNYLHASVFNKHFVSQKIKGVKTSNDTFFSVKSAINMIIPCILCLLILDARSNCFYNSSSSD